MKSHFIATIIRRELSSEVVAEFKKLGRFAEPALRLVHQHSGATGAESIESQLLATAAAPVKN
jgi:hypothetical protein